MLRRESEDVQSSVMVTIMRHTTVRTNPISYFKTCDTSRPRFTAQRAARRAGLSTVPFIAFDILAAMLNSLVRQHCPERRPASIQDGFRHLGFSQLAGIDVTNDYAAVRSRKSGRFCVEKVASRVGDLRVNGLSSFLVASPLCHGKLLLKAAEVSGVINHFSIGECGERLKSKINADFTVSFGSAACNLANEIDIPSSTRIGAKRTTFDFPANFAAFPITIGDLFIDYGCRSELDSAGNKGNPSQRFLATIAGALADFIAGLTKLPTDCRNRVAMQSKIGTTAGRELDQIKSRRPFPAPSESVLLRVNAVIPDVVTGVRVSGKMISVFVLDPISVSKHHWPNLIGLMERVKWNLNTGMEDTLSISFMHISCLSLNIGGRYSIRMPLNDYIEYLGLCALISRVIWLSSTANLTMCTYWSVIHRKYLCLSWSTRLRACRRGACVKSGKMSLESIGMGASGQPVILWRHAEVRRYLFSANILNNRKGRFPHRPKEPVSPAGEFR